MPLLQGSLMVAETMNDGINPAWEPTREPCWDELSDTQKADKVAKRLLSNSKLPAGIYVSVHATENMWTGDIVVLDEKSNASKWTGTGHPSGIAIGPLGKGCFGWIQTKS